MTRIGLAFTQKMAIRALALALVWAFVTGCTTHYIPNTDVEDNDQNRKVIDFCEEYRRAVETENVDKLLKLADPRYYEDGGNVDASDDLDYAGLRDYLQTRFKDTRSIRYEIRYRRIGEGRKKRSIFVDYTYSASYKIPTPSGELWKHRVAENRLELVPNADSFLILSGM
jgi:hypothetical protein